MFLEVVVDLADAASAVSMQRHPRKGVHRLAALLQAEGRRVARMNLGLGGASCFASVRLPDVEIQKHTCAGNDIPCGNFAIRCDIALPSSPKSRRLNIYNPSIEP